MRSRDGMDTKVISSSARWTDRTHLRVGTRGRVPVPFVCTLMLL
jgi:hypothetical protein